MSRERVRLLVVQGRVPHYRIPFFDLLGQREWLDVTLLHSGKRTSAHTSYAELIAEKTTMLGFHYQHGLLSVADDYDIVVGMFDVHWLSILATAMKRRTRFLWWGIGLGNRRLMDVIRLLLILYNRGVIVYSFSAKRRFLELGIQEEKVFVAPNTVSVNLTSSILKMKKRKNFLFIGSLHPRKQVSQLLRAYAINKRRFPIDCKIEIVGAGSEKPALRALSAKLGIQKYVIFWGEITQDNELEEIFTRALAVVSPGQAGLAVLQSFAFGVPFITKQHAISGGEIENIEDGTTGFLYDGTIDSLGELLVLLANNPKIAHKLGVCARDYYLKNRTIHHMVDGFEAALRRVYSHAS